MFSLSKLLILVAIVVAVWYGFRLVTRLQKERDRLARERGEELKRDGRKPAKRASAAEDMSQCPACGVYVPQDAPKCGRPGCPQG